MSDTDLTRVEAAKRREDKFITIRLVMDVLFVCLGFWLGNTILIVNSTLREHDKSIAQIQTTIEIRTKARDDEMLEFRTHSNETVGRLEKNIDKLTDKVDKIAEKVGAR